MALTWGQCDPIPKIWQPFIAGKCMDKAIQIHYNMFTAVYSGAMDIVLAVLPWKIIWILGTMNKKEKFGVLVAMSMGVFAGVTSIIKATELPAIRDSDFTFASTNLVILGIAESAITIMAASIPILRALLREHRGGPRPPPPAEFYNLDSLENQQSDQMYAGTKRTQGTGRSSTTVTTNRTGRSKRRGSLFGSLSLTRGSRSSSNGRNMKDEEAGNGHGHGPVVHVHHVHAAETGGHGNGRPAVMMRRLSIRLSSAFSVGFGTAGGFGGESDTVVHQPSVSGESHGGVGTVVHVVMDPPPPGKIVKEREVTIAYDQRSPTPPDTQKRMSEWPSYPTKGQGSDADLAHVHAMRPWGDDDDDGTKESMGRR